MFFRKVGNEVNRFYLLVFNLYVNFRWKNEVFVGVNILVDRSYLNVYKIFENEFVLIFLLGFIFYVFRIFIYFCLKYLMLICIE